MHGISPKSRRTRWGGDYSDTNMSRSVSYCNGAGLMTGATAEVHPAFFLMLSTREGVIPAVVCQMSLEENRKRYSNTQSHGPKHKMEDSATKEWHFDDFGLIKQSRPIYEHNKQNKCSASIVERMQ